MSEAPPDEAREARRIAADARDRVRFEEEALALADQVYRVARHLVGSRDGAEDLMQEAYARAFRSWRSFTPGTNLRAWLLRILTNLNIDRGRREQRAPDFQTLDGPSDYYLADRLGWPQIRRPDMSAHLARQARPDAGGYRLDIPRKSAVLVWAHDRGGVGE